MIQVEKVAGEQSVNVVKLIDQLNGVRRTLTTTHVMAESTENESEPHFVTSIPIRIMI